MSEVQPSSPKTPGIVVTAFVLSLFGFACGVPAVVGLILGIIGLKAARKAAKGKGLAIAAITISAVWLAIVAVIAVAGAQGGGKTSQVSGSQATSEAAPEQTPVESSDVTSRPKWIADLRGTDASMFESVSDSDLEAIVNEYCSQMQDSGNVVASFGVVLERYPLTPVAAAATTALGAAEVCPGQETGALLMGKAIDDGSWGNLLTQNERYAKALALTRQVLPEYDSFNDNTIVLGAIAACRMLYTMAPGEALEKASITPGTENAKMIYMLSAVAEQTFCTGAPRSSKDFAEAFANGG